MEVAEEHPRRPAGDEPDRDTRPSVGGPRNVADPPRGVRGRVFPRDSQL